MGCCQSDDAKEEQESLISINWEEYADDIKDDINKEPKPLVSDARITVRSLTDKITEYDDIDLTKDTIETLKGRIQDKDGIPPQQQILCIDKRNQIINYVRRGNKKLPDLGVLMKNNILTAFKSKQKLSDTPIRDGQELLLILKLRGVIDKYSEY